ncbi:NHL repeat protein [compost metagenome]
MTPAGVVTTLAGSTTSGRADGIGAAASFAEPAGITIDGNGILYVADHRNNLIRKLVP